MINLENSFRVLQDALDSRSKKINKIEKLKEVRTPIDFYNELESLCS